MIWCLGMYASGSTWLYNAARQTAGLAAPGQTLRAVYADNIRQLLALTDPALTYIVKTHDLDARSSAFMTCRAGAILLSIRDPRDAVVSLMQHMRHDFATALAHVERSARYAGRFADDPRSRLLRYESGFTDDPAIFQRLAAVFGGELAPAEIASLFAASRRDVIEAKIARLEDLPSTVANPASGDIVDLDSQWHRHHAHRSGEIGRWQRMLNADALHIVERRLGYFMARFNYPTVSVAKINPPAAP